MSDVAIGIVNLGKSYLIGAPQTRYKTIRESIVDGVKAPFKRAGRLLRGQAYGAAGLDHTIWALKDVSFEVERGEVVGIIGRNGAGKTTLLKVLSQITEPTEGEVMLRGRVGSLLEVGTGFHPELTGRENIYLNGAILGMRRDEIERRFDEIVAFSEIEKFIDTPSKHYSSGMYIRLAFSVAAHLEPEILLVDEVLAVGDYAFQRKCLGKMSEVANEGRTVLFVSHNMATIQRLCTRAVLISHGEVAIMGDVKDVIETYLTQDNENVASIFDLYDRDFPKWQRRLRGDLRFNKCVLLDSQGEACSKLRFGEPITIHLEALSPIAYDDLDLGVMIFSAGDVHITTIRNDELDMPICIKPDRPLQVNITVDELVLLPGRYYLSFFVHSGRYASDVILRLVQFAVSELIYDENTPLVIGSGLIRTSATWEIGELTFWDTALT